jgi:hypothetical protein
MDGTVPTPWGTIADSIDDCEPNSSTATNVSQSDVMGPSPVLQQQITPEMVAQGYQPGMGAQTVVVGGQSKGPKVPLIISAVLVVIGLIGFAVAAVVGASLEDTFKNLSTEEYTTVIDDNGELTYADADELGEEGWYLLIPGDPKADENGNGISDACEGVNFSVVDSNGEDASDRVARISCSTSEGDNTNIGEEYFDIKDHVIVARICHTINGAEGNLGEHRCAEGEVLTVSNDANISMSVVDLDEMYGPFVEELISSGLVAMGGSGAGCCSMCGGVIALIVGLMRLGGGKNAPQMQFQIQ